MIMKIIKEFLFGRRANPVCDVCNTYHTIKPSTALTFEQWCIEFRVSMLHGKQITEMN